MGEPRMGVAVPNVFVRDLQEALAYYTGALGFETLFQFGQPAFYAQVRRDEAVLALRCLSGPALDHDLAVDVLSAFIEVKGVTGVGVDAVFASMQSAGALVYQAPRDEPWGMRSFIFRDPVGNLICFAATL